MNCGYTLAIRYLSKSNGSLEGWQDELVVNAQDLEAGDLDAIPSFSTFVV